MRTDKLMRERDIRKERSVIERERESMQMKKQEADKEISKLRSAIMTGEYEAASTESVAKGTYFGSALCYPLTQYIADARSAPAIRLHGN